VGNNYVGVSDLSLITRRSDARSAASNAVITKMIGNDANFLRDRSPVSHVANIRVPTLHAYGLNDPRVKIENWTELEAALKKYNKTYQSVVVKNEGHGFEKSESSIEFFRVVESFLNKYMPATRSAAASNVDKDKPATSSAQN
jgi:dipeptidyl aminopeptidase/acylaminoacyl peptidase